jgi:effector-binding domain-containing protein
VTANTQSTLFDFGISSALAGKANEMDSEQNESNGSGVEVRELEAQPILSIRTTITAKELGEKMGEKFEALRGHLQKIGIAPAGPPFVRYHTFDWETETDFEMGVPVGERVEGAGWIASGELPGGPVVSTWHLGAHDKLGEAYGRINGWLKENGREVASPLWEIYYWMDAGKASDASAQSDPATWRLELVQPYR